MRLARFPTFLTALLLGIGCRDVTAPEPSLTAGPKFSHSGTGGAFHGAGSLGPGTSTAGSSRQDFQFDIASDLSGTLDYRDWSIMRADGNPVMVTVSPTDPFTGIVVFRNTSAACADPSRGTEIEGWARLDRTGSLVAFTLVGCDAGAAGSGMDFFRLSIPDAGYAREGLLSSGDVVKNGTAPAPSSPQATGEGWFPPGRPTPDSYGKHFDFSVTSAPSGRLVYTDYETVRADGTRGGFTVDPQIYPATRVTSYHQISSTCVRFAGTGRIDTGQLAAFWVDVCDNANPGTGHDTFALNVPNVFTKGGTLTAGDIVLGAPAPTTGDLSVAAATSGENLDPDGYTVTIDGTTSQALPLNGSVNFAGLSAGDHAVTLSGVASNCTVSGGSSRTATVPAGGTASVTFSVSCAPLRGDLAVGVATTGVNLDPDGYTLTVDGADPRAIAINGNVTYAGLPAGDHTVAISGLAPNCTASGGNSRTVSVPAGGTATASFSITCGPGPATRLAFTVQPSNTRAGSTIQPAVQVTALDAQGNRATSFNGLVTIAIGHNGGGLLTPGRLSGTLTVRAVNGVATFSDLSIDRAGDYTLRTTSSGLTGAESRTFRIESSSLCLLVICIG